MISPLAMRQACWTIHERDRSCRLASAWISLSMSSGKYRDCLRLSVPAIAAPWCGTDEGFVRWEGRSVKKASRWPLCCHPGYNAAAEHKKKESRHRCRPSVGPEGEGGDP